MQKFQDFAMTATLKLAVKKRKNTHVRAREPVSRSKGRVVGYYASWKNKRPIAWESQLERDACSLFEFSKGVVAFSEQPETFEFEVNGKQIRYTPDFKLSLVCGGEALIEIKPESLLKDQEMKNRLSAASDHIRKTKEADFFVLTEKEIRVPNYQFNLTILKHYCKLELSSVEISGLKTWLKNNKQAPVFSLSKMLGSSPKAFAFIAQGHAKIDLSQRLSETSTVFTNEENSDESVIFTCRFAPDFA